MIHQCIRTQYGQRFGCSETSLQIGKLLFTLHDPKTDINETDIDNFICVVDFCPFCGYRSNIKHEKEMK